MKRISKIFISAFLLINFLAKVRVHLPLDRTFFKTLYRPVDAYLSFFSIYQDWLMFAPNPTRMNASLSAEILFEDGSSDIYRFPRSAEMGIVDKYTHGEKYRKIITEAIRNDSHSWMWKDTAKFALRKMKEKSFSKIPLKVHLYRHWAETPPMTKKFIPHGESIPGEKKYKFYTYEVI